ncbi:MAG: prepilin-type N-terminal cleavage/methylation domain-containing protein [Sideroxyarcus sp.]
MKKHSIATGFTLVEMAVVLTIVALLLGGLLPMISSQMEQQRRTETRKQMDEITAALYGFAVANGRMPCPDINNDGNEDFAAASSVSNNSPAINQSTVTTSCAAAGVPPTTLPYNQLGTGSLDGFGSPFVYSLTPAFGAKNEVHDALNGGGTVLYTYYFKLDSTGAIRVCDQSPCALLPAPVVAPTKSLTDTAVAVVVSRGPNWALPQSLEENENTNNNTSFVSHTPSPTFDDLVIWISPNTLFNRMVAAGKLP